MRFKEWACRCQCGFKGHILGWDTDLPFSCPTCDEDTDLVASGVNASHAVIGDDIPGGMLISHGICHEDGSPKRYYSRTDIKRAANAKGLVIQGDTPKTYKV